MPQVADDVASLLEYLSQRINDLEVRVAALERPLPTAPAQPAMSTATAGRSTDPSINHLPGTVLQILGKATLAMAGAYLLRAIAESGAIARLPMIFSAIAYASLWMAWAVRVHRKDHFASATYGITATVILAPLLYESTVRFHLLSIPSTSAVLVAFVVLVLVLAWRANLQVLPWVATLASIATLWALILSTHALVPLTIALLGIALATEIASCLGHRFSLWAMTAIAADAAVLLFIYVMTLPGGVPSSYTMARPSTTALLSFSLLTIYGGGIAIRSFGERKHISNFEILQEMLAFALAYLGITRATNAIAPLLGTLFMALSFVCYWGVLSRFAGAIHTRNRRVSSTWAVMLMLAAIVVVLSPGTGTLASCIAALAAVSIYWRSGILSFAVHATLYLTLAAVLSRCLSYVREAFIGSIPGASPWAVWVVLISALLCYSVSTPTSGARWSRRLLWMAPAALASATVAALGVAGFRTLMATQFEVGNSQIAGIRTAIMCLVAMTLGFVARRLKRPELGWLAYTAVGFGALKLLFEDLRFGNAASLVVSLMFYGLILILLPRLLRRGDSTHLPQERTI